MARKKVYVGLTCYSDDMVVRIIEETHSAIILYSKDIYSDTERDKLSGSTSSVILSE